MERPNFVTKKSLTDTLMGMPLKKEFEIKAKDFKPETVRAAVARLGKRGYRFTVSGAGRIDSVVVMRME